MEIVKSLKRVERRGRTRLYRARLSNADVIFVCACAVQSLKGLFQPKAITAAMITISINSRRMTTETEQKVRGRSIEFVTSLRRYHARSSAFTRLRAAKAERFQKRLRVKMRQAGSSLLSTSLAWLVVDYSL